MEEPSLSDPLPRSGDAPGERERERNNKGALKATGGSRELDAVLECETAGADVTRDIGIKPSRTGEGSRAAKECSRTRPAGGGVAGKSEVREGGVGEGDWECEFGLSGDEARGEDMGSGEVLGKVEGVGGDGSALVPGEVEEDGECELI